MKEFNPNGFKDNNIDINEKDSKQFEKLLENHEFKNRLKLTRG
jgi:hypothetical protein